MTSAQTLTHPNAPVASVPAGGGLAGLCTDGVEPGELEALLERFLVSIVAMAGAQAGAVRVLTEDGTQMRLVAHLGLQPHVANAERLVHRDCGKCGVAARSDTLAWIDSVTACANQTGQTYFGLECQRVLAISLLYGGEVLGVYNLFFGTPVQLDAQTEGMLHLIGQMLGQALHNARVQRDRLRLTVIRERQEMVNEVHDVIAQTLAYVRMRLPLLSEAMLAHDDQRSIKYFADIKDAVGEVHHNLREVMTHFRTRMDPLGLMHAIHGIATTFSSRTGIALEVRNRVQNLGLSDEQEIQVFHIVQEALANTAKHSMARHVVLGIDRTPRHLEFVIEDDGLGMAAPSVSTIVTMAKGMSGSSHFGLEIMRNRAHQLGADLEIGVNDGGGTRVRLSIPSSVLAAERFV